MAAECWTVPTIPGVRAEPTVVKVAGRLAGAFGVVLLAASLVAGCTTPVVTGSARTDPAGTGFRSAQPPVGTRESHIPRP